MDITPKNARHILTAVKLAPVISSAGMFVIVLFLLKNGHQTPTTELMRAVFEYSTFGTIVLIIASYYLHLCTMHRLFILYTEFVTDACAYQASVGFGSALIYFRLFALISGIILFIYLFTHLKQYFNNGRRRNQQSGPRFICKRSA